MLRRFMNWLLHQLQKVLGAISGRRSSSRPATPKKAGSGVKDRPEVLAQQKASSDPIIPAQPGISFSLQPDEPVANLQDADSSSLDSTKDELDTDDFGTSDSDTYVRLDAASSTISDVGGDISSKKSTPVSVSEALLSPTSQTTEPPTPEQLPSIQDLIPAVEQEIKDNSATYSEQVRADPDAVPATAGTDATSLGDASVESVESSEPFQALLFSFDITESVAGETDAGVVESNSPLVESIDVASDISEEPTVANIDADVDAIAQFVENSTDLTDNVEAQSFSETVEETNPEQSPPESAAIERASLPYPWSIAVPKSTEESEDVFSSLQETADSEQTSSAPLEVEETIAEERSVEASIDQTSKPGSTSAISQTDRSVKDGVVKLLFTVKEGNYHGYIEPKDGSSDILFHQKYINADIFNSLERGVEVVVSVKYLEGKAYATQVELAQ